jgi:hypothetical protein
METMGFAAYVSNTTVRMPAMRLAQ